MTINQGCSQRFNWGEEAEPINWGGGGGGGCIFIYSRSARQISFEINSNDN